MDNLILIITSIMVALAFASCDTVTFDDKNVTMGSPELPCVLITECPFALKLINISNIQELRRIFCGYEGKYPKVLCFTANNENEKSIIVFNKTIEAATSRPKKPVEEPVIHEKVTTTIKPLEQPVVYEKVTTTIKLLEQPTTIQQISGMESSYPFPSRKVCGQHNLKVSNRIVGGVLTEIEEFPWLARLGYGPQEKNAYCSASLITDQYLVTAAHCVTRKTPVSVRLGEWDIETEKDCMSNRCNDKPVDKNVSATIIHPSYHSSGGIVFNDIAILRLDEPVKFTEFIQPICLPTSEFIASADYVSGTTYWTAGWGLTEFGDTSAIKRKVELDAVPVDICQGVFSQLPLPTATIICAGGRQGLDSCRGDSGGSLVREIMEDDNINWYILGITSYGSEKCGTAGKPGIYTRISYYMDWIKEIVSK